jgi:hypothetical protein
MNANELADEIMEHYKAELPRGFNVNWMQEATTMLRQQQAEIEALKQIIDANNLSQNIGQFVKPANESIAYVNSMCNDYIDWKIDPMSIDGQPLYIHLAKTLTDEEILKMASDKFHYSEYRLVIDFARTILKKASEK